MKTNINLKLVVSIGMLNPIPLNAQEVINVFTPIMVLSYLEVALHYYHD